MNSPVWSLLAGCLLMASCKPRETGTPAAAGAAPVEPVSVEPASASHMLVADFPLLPMVEKSRWRELLDAEAKATAADPGAKASAKADVDRLVEKLRSLHPFRSDARVLTLGGISYDKPSRRFSLPARVRYPDPGDDRHPGELELLLCTEAGRTHETLFVCDARPLHLELLMHLAGFARDGRKTRFQIDVLTDSGARIPAHVLLRAKDGDATPAPLLWEFSGSGFGDLYAPDLTGDFAIFWHAHDSVLRIDHPGIASGTVKLEAFRHPGLPHGAKVTLEIRPADG